MSEIKNYICPSCNRPILHDPDNGEASETCGCCGRTWTIEELEAGLSSGGAVGGATMESHPETNMMLAYSDDAESALAYLENYFETFDWEAFGLTSALSIPDVDKMLEKVLIKAAAHPATWELKFTAVATPLFKKLNALKNLEKTFFAAYAQLDDLSDIYPLFDTYRLIARRIVLKRESILKELASALKFYEKYNGSPEVLGQMKDQYDMLEGKLNAVKIVKSYKDLAGYPDAQAEKQRIIVKKLADAGIDAEAEFTKAVSDYRGGADRRRVLASFRRLAGYKNASEYADIIDAHMSIEVKYGNTNEGIFVRLGKKHYFFREETQTFKVEETKSGCFAKLFKKKKEEPAPEEPEDVGKTKYSLHEIVDKKVQKDPVVGGITEILTQYAGYLVYIKNNSSLCIFNSNAQDAASAETVVRESKRGAFDTPGKKTNWFCIGNHLYLLEKLDAMEVLKRGCFAKLFRRKPKVRITTKNNYALLDFNLETGAVKTAVDELVDIMDTFGEEIFYSIIKKPDAPKKKGCFAKLFKKKKEEPEDKRAFLVYDCKTGKSREILSEDTEIVDVVDGKVVYFRWKPNYINKDMWTLDLASNESKMVAKNVFDYFRSIDGKLFYFVGNAGDKTLYSIHPDGTGRKEILRKAGRLSAAVEHNGWLYLQIGSGLNAALVKISMETGERVTVCAQFKRLIKLRDGYVYYIDTLNSLRVVREDGTGNKCILDDIGEIVSVGEESIYLLRNEYGGVVDCTEVAKNRTKSLYKVSLEGAELEKLYFDVCFAVLNASNEEEVYLYTILTKEFDVTTPISLKKSQTARERRVIRTLSLYNTTTDETTEVAILGRPESDPATFKKGCFKKKKIKRDIQVEEVEFKISYGRLGKMAAGAISEEQVEEHDAEEARKKAEYAAKSRKERKKDKKKAKKEKKKAKKQAKKAK